MTNEVVHGILLLMGRNTAVSQLDHDVLKQLRDNKEWSLDELAHRLYGVGVSTTKDTLSRLESGKTKRVDLSLVLGIADVFGVGLDALLTD